MSKIKEVFKKTKPFIAYITAGDPGLKKSQKLVLALARAGADIIELGVPFSDPLADGPTIQESHRRALKKGTSLIKIMELVKSLRKKTNIPIILMGASNLFLAYDLKQFFADAAKVGVDGVIIPDLPPEEAEDFLYLGEHYGVELIFLAATTSSEKRLKLIAEASKSFIYLISSTGLTGERQELTLDKIAATVNKLKSYNDCPVAVGFGISSGEQVEDIYKIADGAIVGSAIVKRIARSPRRAVSFVKKLIRKLDSK